MITVPTPEEIMDRFDSSSFAYVLHIRGQFIVGHRRTCWYVPQHVSFPAGWRAWWAVRCYVPQYVSFPTGWRAWWAVPVDWEPWQVRALLAQLGTTALFHLCEHCMPDRRKYPGWDQRSTGPERRQK
jgi:hypothetical protein